MPLAPFLTWGITQRMLQNSPTATNPQPYHFDKAMIQRSTTFPPDIVTPSVYLTVHCRAFRGCKVSPNDPRVLLSPTKILQLP